jgi:hypothetical protein
MDGLLALVHRGNPSTFRQEIDLIENERNPHETPQVV